MASKRITRGSLKRKGNIWHCRWKHGGREIWRKGGLTKRAAEAKLSQIHTLRLAGASLLEAIRHVWREPAPTTGAVTWRELTRRYIEHVAAKGDKSVATMDKKRYRAAAFLGDDGFAETYVAETGRTGAARWYDARKAERTHLGKPRSATTMNRMLSLGSAVWRYGRHRGYVPEDARNPFRSTDNRTQERGLDKDPLTPDELAVVVETAATLHPDFHDLLVAAAHSGCRLGELTSLTRDDVDLVTGCLIVRAAREKTRRGRVVPLTPQLAVILRRRLDIPRLTTRLVFLRADGKPWTSKTANHRLRAVLAACPEGALRAHQPHDLKFKALRDLFVTTMIGVGVPWPVVGKLAGHAHAATTLRYVGRLTDAQRDAIGTLGGTLGGTSGGTNSSSGEKTG